MLLFAHGDCPTSPLALRRLEGVSKGVVLVRGEACRGARVARRARVGFQTLAQSADRIASRAFQVETVPTAGTKWVHESGHARPLLQPQNRSVSSENAPRVPASGRVSLTCHSLVMKGSPVRVRASALSIHAGLRGSRDLFKAEEASGTRATVHSE
jgi:hypothetical protein